MKTNAQYINTPPSIPFFLFKTKSSAIKELIVWAKKEHHDWLIYLSSGGYWKTLKKFNEEVSPYRILAELSGFRKICSVINEKTWNELEVRDRAFIRRAYSLRDVLFR